MALALLIQSSCLVIVWKLAMTDVASYRIIYYAASYRIMSDAASYRIMYDFPSYRIMSDAASYRIYLMLLLTV